MKRVALSVLFLILTFAGYFGSAGVAQAAGVSCAELFAPRSERLAFLNHLESARTPYFMKQTTNGPVPVILANARTRPALKSLMDSSVGIQILLQPNTPYSDHGMLRLGGVRSSSGELGSVQIDWGMPGTRGSVSGGEDEIHATGLAWRDVDARLKRNDELNKYSLKTIEAVFRLTKTERSDLEYYQRVRRAAIFARGFVDYEGVLQPQVPNRMAAFEDCFMYCRGTQLEAHAERIADHLRAYGPYDVDEIMNAPQSKRFLRWARQTVMQAPWLTSKTLHPEMLFSEKKIRSLGGAIPTFLKTSEGELRPSAYVFVNWMVALDATRAASRVYRALKITDSYGIGNEFENPRLNAVLIYDSPDAAQKFFDATYSTPGKDEHAGWGEGPPSEIRPYHDQFKAHP